MRILLVEDDDLIVQPLTKVLTAQHYIVDSAIDGEVGWELAESINYDLILLDVMLPKLDGISFCRRLRSQGNQTPILLLTAQDASINKVLGLDAGADDYVAKPFDLQELLARMRALLRRGNTTLPPLLEWRSIQLDPSNCEVTCGSQRLHLTPKEYGVLELLLRNPHRIFSCSALIDHLWSLEEPPTDETVRSHVKGLRQKLKAAGVEEDPITTVYGIGYRLKAAERESQLGQGGKGRQKDDKGELAEHRTDRPSERQTERQTDEKNLHFSSEAVPNAVQNQASHLSSPTAQAIQQVSQGVASVWEEVKDQLSQRIAVIEQASSLYLQDQLDAELQQQAYRETHRLIGSLGMFGMDAGSQLAQAIEPLFAPGISLSSQQRQDLIQQVQALRQELQTMEPISLLELPIEPAAATGSLALPKEATLLIVDDDAQILIILQRLLQPWGFQVSTLDQPQHLLAILEQVMPDLLILDVEMPPISGIELCQQLRSQPQWSGLPILFLTAHTDAKTMHQVFAAGADDYVSKPIVGPALVTRILNRLERSRLLRNLTETDVLTGVYNRRKSTQELQHLLQQCDLHQQPLCLALLDLDRLKQINHQHGHPTADRVLAQFGELLRCTFQPENVVGRWGGTEFVVGMPGITQPEGIKRLADVVQRLHQLEFRGANSAPFLMTCSAAIVQYPQAGTDLQMLYQAADLVLDQAKAAGGNQVYFLD